MPIPFAGRQKNNVWQLVLQPCVFALLFFAGIQPAFFSIGLAAWQFGSAALFGLLLGALALLLPGGLRSCAIGMNVFLAGMALWAMAAQWRAQRAAGFPGGWIYLFYYDRVMAVLTIAFACYLFLCLPRLLLPTERLGAAPQQGFASFFHIAGVGLLCFHCLVLFYSFFLARQSVGMAAIPNLVPFRSIKKLLAEMHAMPWLAYENIVNLAGNVLLFFPLGFFLRGLLRQKTWLALLLPSLFSLLMELLQYLLRIGFAEMDDLLLNTLGAGVGVLTAILFEALRTKRTQGAERSIFAPVSASQKAP
ncbi:MAG: VanZ family protein [Oscillospiraceae bacterium]|nr:VanZ family protein [Oscillospiraceae bacterium]